MVQLHASRHGQAGVRPTEDIDILADSRQRPKSLTEVIAQRLIKLGYQAGVQTGLIGAPTLFSFERDGSVVDVLGPDGTKFPPKTIANNETIKVPGGTQALARTEVIELRVEGGRTGRLRCPTLPGAILLKARSITKKHRDQDRQDLVVLLSCVDDPLAVKQDLTRNERRWLRNAAGRLDIDSADLEDLIPAEQLARARATYELLTRP